MRWLEPVEGRELPHRRMTGHAARALVLAFIIVGVLYSVVTPLYEASDELWHYPFVEHLANGHGLPVQDPKNPGPWLQEGSQPPLYYALAAAISRWIPGHDQLQVLAPNPHASVGVVRPDGNANMVIHTPAEAFPYHAVALAIHLVRGLSVLLGALTVLFGYAIGLEVLPRRPEFALAGAAIAAFTPMFLFISGSVNNDNLVVALATIALWQMLRLLRLPPTPLRLTLLGVTIGLAALAKLSGLALLPLAALVLAWVAWRRRDWATLVWGGACMVGATVVVAGWWYARNWRLYHDPTGMNVFVAIAGPRPYRLTLRQLVGEWPSLATAYWGAFGGMNVVAPPWVYQALNALALLGAAGLVVAALRCAARRRWPSADVAARLALVSAWPLVVFAGLVRWTMTTRASQGRLVFPAIGCLSYLLALGLASWVRRRWQWLPLLATPVLLVTLALWVPFGVISPAYARPPLLTAAEEAAIPHRLDLVFAEQMQLLGYRLAATELEPGQDLVLTLYWRGLTRMERNYSVFVHVLDSNEIKIAQRDVYPGQGLFPTSQWQPGDAIEDRYVVRVPANTFNPSRIQLRVGLYQLEDGRRLPVRDVGGRELGDSVRFGEIMVRRAPRDGIANPIYHNLDNKVALVGYDLDRTALRAGETLRLTLFWRALVPLQAGYTAVAHVRGADGTIWAGKASPVGGVSGDNWPTGKVIRESRDLVLRPDTPAGVYGVSAGMYLAEKRESLIMRGQRGQAEGVAALLAWIRVLPGAPEPAGVQLAAAPAQHPLDVSFSGVGRLKGFSLDGDVANPNEPLCLTLHWEALNEGPLPTGYAVFVHALDTQGQIVTQHDGAPALGMRPTTAWVKGQAITDQHWLSFSDSLYSGQIRFRVGLYDQQSMQRVQTAGGDDGIVLPVEVAVRP